MAKPMPKIKDCDCGSKATCRQLKLAGTWCRVRFYMACTRPECGRQGPFLKTPRGAIKAWNRGMGGDDGE